MLTAKLPSNILNDFGFEIYKIFCVIYELINALNS